MNSDVLFHSLLLIMLPYKCKAGSTMTRLFLFFIIWWLAWKAGQRYAQNIMSQVQQMLTMTVQSYLRKLHMKINRNRIIFTHHRIPMWAVNMRNSQSAILKHLNYKRTLGLSWIENISNASPSLLFLSQHCIQSAVGKGIAFCCEKAKRIHSLSAVPRNVPLKAPVIERPVQSFSSHV